jgi:hypothetical protein
LKLVARNTAEIRVGRLLEVRATAGYRTASNVDLLFDALDQEIRKMPSRVRVVTAVDWRFCPLMSPEAAQHIGKRMAANNERMERCGALVNRDAPLSVLQFLRVVREADHPDRKLFFDQIECVQYLAELLSPAELARMYAFLAEGMPKAPVAK